MTSCSFHLKRNTCKDTADQLLISPKEKHLQVCVCVCVDGMKLTYTLRWHIHVSVYSVQYTSTRTRALSNHLRTANRRGLKVHTADSHLYQGGRRPRHEAPQLDGLGRVHSDVAARPEVRLGADQLRHGLGQQVRLRKAPVSRCARRRRRHDDVLVARHGAALLRDGDVDDAVGLGLHRFAALLGGWHHLRVELPLVLAERKGGA